MKTLTEQLMASTSPPMTRVEVGRALVRGDTVCICVGDEVRGRGNLVDGITLDKPIECGEAFYMRFDVPDD